MSFGGERESEGIMRARSPASSKVVHLAARNSERLDDEKLFLVMLVVLRENDCNFTHAMPDAAIHTLGHVLEKLASVLYRVELPNGKIIMAHLSKPLTVANAEFSVGDRLLLELTPYDFDQARILEKTE